MKTIMLVVEERENVQAERQDARYPHLSEPCFPTLRKLEVELTEAKWAIAKQAIFAAFCEVGVASVCIARPPGGAFAGTDADFDRLKGRAVEHAARGASNL